GSSALEALLCSRRRIDNLYLNRDRSNLAVLPVWERQRHLRLANACFVWDPHGAVKTIPSTPMVKGDFGLNSFAALPGKFDLGDRVDISRHDVARDRCEGALIPARCADPDRKSTAALSPREYLIGSVEQCESQRAIKVNYRGVLRLVPEGF